MTKVQRAAWFAERCESLKSFLKANKFKRIYKHPETKIWANRFLIIKETGTKVLTIPPKGIVETEEVLFDGRHYLIQPKVKPGDNIAARILHEREPRWIDAGRQNCGWYKKQPVIIDW